MTLLLIGRIIIERSLIMPWTTEGLQIQVSSYRVSVQSHTHLRGECNKVCSNFKYIYFQTQGSAFRIKFLFSVALAACTRMSAY